MLVLFEIFLAWTAITLGSTWNPYLINGQVVSRSDYPHIVPLNCRGIFCCSATVVGPRAIVTAAHCLGQRPYSITARGKEYAVDLYAHPLYSGSGNDPDVAIGITKEEIQDLVPANVAGTATKGASIILYGYGCKTVGGRDNSDGNLRRGTSKITQLGNYDMYSQGSGLCYGDSGGPAFISEFGEEVLLGINSRGNIRDSNINLRLDLPKVISFLEEHAIKRNVDICGITRWCD